MINSDFLCFKPHFHVKIVNSKNVVLFSEDKQHLLKRSVYSAIAEIIIKKPTTENTIFSELLKKNIYFQNIQEALARLKQKNYHKIY